MANTGVKYPGTIASTAVAPYDDINWTNVANIGAADDAEATILSPRFDSPKYSNVIQASNFGFTIPSGATIDGILVEIEHHCDSGETTTDVLVQLSKDNSALVGSNLGGAATLPLTATNVDYGGAANLWGATWNDSEINATTFAVWYAVQATTANADTYADYIRVTVYYTEGLAKTGVFSLSASGAVSATGKKDAKVGITVTGTGLTSSTSTKGAKAGISVTGSGAVFATSKKGAKTGITVTSAGLTSSTGTKGAKANISVTGSGASTSTGSKVAKASISLSAGGSVNSTGKKATGNSFIVSITGNVTFTGVSGNVKNKYKQRMKAMSLSLSLTGNDINKN